MKKFVLVFYVAFVLVSIAQDAEWFPSRVEKINPYDSINEPQVYKSIEEAGSWHIFVDYTNKPKHFDRFDCGIEHIYTVAVMDDDQYQEWSKALAQIKVPQKRKIYLDQSRNRKARNEWRKNAPADYRRLLKFHTEQETTYTISKYVQFPETRITDQQAEAIDRRTRARERAMLRRKQGISLKKGKEPTP